MKYRYVVKDVAEINSGLVEITYDVYDSEMMLARLTAQILISAIPENQLIPTIQGELQRRFHDYINAPKRLDVIRGLEWEEHEQIFNRKALADQFE